MSHKDIASVAEPWLMLPFSYAYKKEGVLTEYAHNVSYAAFEDFIDNLPNKENDYYQALGDFANILYEKQCLNDEKYFLDKTPRYYHIIPQIAKAFPDAKFIFLFRNPIHVMSSMMQTWCDGRFKNLHIFEQDFRKAPELLSSGYELLKDKAYAVQYEEYVQDPEKYTKEICGYLEIKYDENMLSSFSSQNTKGRMGDPTGVKEYKHVDTKSLEKWKKTFDSKFRQKYIRRYIETIDDKILETQGYSKDKILSEINSLTLKKGNFYQDILDVTYSKMVKKFKLNLLLGKTIKNAGKDKYFA